MVRLLDAFGDINELFAQKDHTLQNAGLTSETISYLRKPDPECLRRDEAWLAAPRHHLVTWASDDYPDLLSKTPSAPAALFVAGDPTTLWQPQIAIVGSRNPTSGGVRNAQDFASEIARRGFVVTSGLASGIDSACHDAAMDTGGRTVAVTGTGLDTVYPASSRQRAIRIPDQGALVSEFPPGTPARRHHFPERNRIISGLSLGVLVIEAGLNSGSLITARLGSEQGREVFALPGSIHNPMSKGCHRLIREGARLAETVDEIIEGVTFMARELSHCLSERLSQGGAASLEKTREKPKMIHNGPSGSVSVKSKQAKSDPDYRRLWENIGFDPMPVDRLVEQSGLTAREVSAMLLMLELRGEVEAHPGGAFSRKQ